MYNLARKGKVVELSPREIEIKEFEITSVNIPEIFQNSMFKRDLHKKIAHDLGKELGCGGILSSLRRRKSENIQLKKPSKWMN
jgi:tRNA pseudouridine55 synthase